MQLSTIKSGQSVLLKSIKREEKIVRKLNEMGLTPGVKINVVSKVRGSAFIINVRGSRLILGKDLTKNIFVENIDNVKETAFGKEVLV